jgi:hypothetical protein
MFNQKELEILDEINPWIDGELGESRKGRSQIYPLIHIHDEMTYWCNSVNEMVNVPNHLVGTWIVSQLFDEEHWDNWEDLRNQNWKPAEQVEVKTTKWKQTGE